MVAGDIFEGSEHLYQRDYKWKKATARIGAMESVVVSPTAEPRGSTEIKEELFFLHLFLRYTVDSASRTVAAPIESSLFVVKSRVEIFGFYFGVVSSLTL